MTGEQSPLRKPIERDYRTARVFRIFEGTDEIQRRTIARELI